MRIPAPPMRKNNWRRKRAADHAAATARAALGLSRSHQHQRQGQGPDTPAPAYTRVRAMHVDGTILVWPRAHRHAKGKNARARAIFQARGVRPISVGVPRAGLEHEQGHEKDNEHEHDHDREHDQEQEHEGYVASPEEDRAFIARRERELLAMGAEPDAAADPALARVAVAQPRGGAGLRDDDPLDHGTMDGNPSIDSRASFESAAAAPAVPPWAVRRQWVRDEHLPSGRVDHPTWHLADGCSALTPMHEQESRDARPGTPPTPAKQSDKWLPDEHRQQKAKLYDAGDAVACWAAQAGAASGVPGDGSPWVGSAAGPTASSSARSAEPGAQRAVTSTSREPAQSWNGPEDENKNEEEEYHDDRRQASNVHPLFAAINEGRFETAHGRHADDPHAGVEGLHRRAARVRREHARSPHPEMLDMRAARAYINHGATSSRSSRPTASSSARPIEPGAQRAVASTSREPAQSWNGPEDENKNEEAEYHDDRRQASNVHPLFAAINEGRFEPTHSRHADDPHARIEGLHRRAARVRRQHARSPHPEMLDMRAARAYINDGAARSRSSTPPLSPSRPGDAASSASSSLVSLPSLPHPYLRPGARADLLRSADDDDSRRASGSRPTAVRGARPARPVIDTGVPPRRRRPVLAPAAADAGGARSDDAVVVVRDDASDGVVPEPWIAGVPAHHLAAGREADSVFTMALQPDEATGQKRRRSGDEDGVEQGQKRRRSGDEDGERQGRAKRPSTKGQRP